VDWSFMNSLSEKEQMRVWVNHWKWLGPELERIKREELRAMTEEEAAQRAITVMNSRPRAARERARRDTSSGLVEQQRIFSKAHAARSE
jgi:hypothetical protein